MSEIAVRPTNELVVNDDQFQRLAAWAEAASATHKVATQLVQTSFVPEAFRGKPMEATAAILAGSEVGLDPMASLRAFDVIQGTAAPRANTLRAIVQSRGHQIRVVEATPTRAVVEGCRKGENHWQPSTWTIERAQQMGLTGKHNWKAQPQAMLVARATAECARLIAMDAILGIPYAAEEIEDLVEPRSVAAAGPVTAEEIFADDEPVDEPETAPDAAEPITPAQSKMLHTLLGKTGRSDRAVGLAYLSEQLKRTITTSKDVTKAEASQLIDTLMSEPEPKPEPSAEPQDVEWADVATAGGAA